LFGGVKKLAFFRSFSSDNFLIGELNQLGLKYFQKRGIALVFMRTDGQRRPINPIQLGCPWLKRKDLPA
jgi:hypothetical protein